MKRSKIYISDILGSSSMKNHFLNVDKFSNFISNNHKIESELSSEESENILTDLLVYQKEVLHRRKKLNNLNLINSLGEFIILWSKEFKKPLNEISKEVNIQESTLDKLINNFIFVEIEKTSWLTLFRYFDLKIDTWKDLLRKSYILYNNKSSNAQVLSRYDHKDTKNHGISMNNAIDELLTKANLNKNISNINDSEFQKLLIELETTWKVDNKNGS